MGEGSQRASLEAAAADVPGGRVPSVRSGGSAGRCARRGRRPAALRAPDRARHVAAEQVDGILRRGSSRGGRGPTGRGIGARVGSGRRRRGHDSRRPGSARACHHRPARTPDGGAAPRRQWSPVCRGAPWSVGGISPGGCHRGPAARADTCPTEVGTNRMTKRALITGITGQDGSYLTEFLLEKGYEVHGIIRRSSTFSTSRLDHLYRDPHDPDARLTLHYGDLLDSSSLINTLQRVRPRRDLQPRRAEPREGQLRDAGVHGRSDRDGGTAHPRGRAPRGLADPLLPGGQQRDVRPRPREPPERADAVPSAQSVRGVEALLALDDHPVPRGLRPVRGQRDPVQPRVAAARPDVPDPQGDARGRRHRGRARAEDLPRQPRRAARLGLRARVRRGDVADAPARPARRLRHRHRRDAHRPRIRRPGLRARRARLAGVRGDRPSLPAPDRGR